MAAYKQTSWELTDLFPAIDSPELEGSFTDLEASVTAFEAHRSDLTSAISTGAFMSLV